MGANNTDFGYDISHNIGWHNAKVYATDRVTGAKVGVLNWTHLHNSGNEGEVDDFYIHPDHRKNTLALTMIKYAQRISAEKGLVPPSYSQQMTETGFKVAKSLGAAENVVPINSEEFANKYPAGRYLSRNEALIHPDSDYNVPDEIGT